MFLFINQFSSMHVGYTRVACLLQFRNSGIQWQTEARRTGELFLVICLSVCLQVRLFTVITVMMSCVNYILSLPHTK